ncbi:MAG TPA: YcgL domain-containing protein, partial [Nitrococcus sp.]|nr:YcgL domain-containing protein [Nitrococcus sp.]
SDIPPDLLQIMGQLEHVMELVLMPWRRLARAEACTVMRALLIHGYYIQLPAEDEKLPLAASQRPHWH